MHAKIKHLFKRKKKTLLLCLFCVFTAAFLLSLPLCYKAYFRDRVYLNTTFSHFSLGAKKRPEVNQLVSRSIDVYSKSKIKLTLEGQEQEFVVGDLGVNFEKDATVDAIMHSGKGDGQLFSIFKTRTVSAKYYVDWKVFAETLDGFFSDHEKFAKNASIEFAGKNLVLGKSQDGKVVDRSELVKQVMDNFQNLEEKKINLTLINSQPQTNDASLETALVQAQLLVSSQITLFFGYDKWLLSGQSLLDLLAFYPSGQNRASLVEIPLGQESVVVWRAAIGNFDNKQIEVNLDGDQIDLVLEDISAVIDRPAVDATLRFESGRVVEFKSAQDGQVLNREETKKKIVSKLISLSEGKEPAASIELPVKVTKAKIANEEINSLGIRELIGSGVSYFAGSIPNRVHNIGLGSSLINGTLVKPGEIFSFTSLVGPVSKEQGFKQAYVIQSGRTVLDDGGGICQVSTTVFRAALNSGLPIIKRTAHAYRVSYYEQKSFKAGLDATIFSPSVDLQFKNDTSHHILLQTTVDRANFRIQVDIYGTADGRKVELSEPVVSNIIPAPEPKYQDDATLPRGVVKQVDFAASGATSVFTRKVYRNGELILNDTFKSVFRPWQAIFLVGTAG